MFGRRSLGHAWFGKARHGAFLMLALMVATACTGSASPGPGRASNAGVPAAGSAGELVVINYGGTFEKFWTQDVIEPFEKELNVKVTQVTSLTMDTVAKMRAQKDNPQIDVVIMADIGTVTAANEGLLDPLDESKIPNMKELVPNARIPGDPYVQFLYTATVLAYNTDKIKTPPSSWEDLWNPAYAGRVALADTNACCGIPFIVSIARMHGGGLDNMDPGFQRIATLKSNVLAFYTSHDQMANLLNQGEAWIGPWVADRAATQHAQGAPIDLVYPKEGAVLFGNGIGIVKGSRNKELAEKYINHVLAPTPQKTFNEHAFLAPTNKNVQLAPEVARYVPYGDEVLSKLYTLDWNLVSRNTSAWTERWQREITNK